jgi:dethiobiotin synthetase
MERDFFITGTDTGVGKTVLSALLVAALGRQYWKPIQTGAREGTDREAVMKWAAIDRGQTFPESYMFDPPVSPHLAAEQQGTAIELEQIQRPVSKWPLIIEGAGGVLVPINNQALMLDLMRRLDAPVVVAARTTLGTINHTLLTVMAIRKAQLRLHGVVMIGKENVENRRAVERYGNVEVVGSIPWLDTIDRNTLVSVFQRHFNHSVFV